MSGKILAVFHYNIKISLRIYNEQKVRAKLFRILLLIFLQLFCRLIHLIGFVSFSRLKTVIMSYEFMSNCKSITLTCKNNYYFV